MMLHFYFVIALLSMSLAQELNSSIAEIQNNVLRFSYELEKHWLSTNITPCDDFYSFVCSKVANNKQQRLQKQSAELLNDAHLKINATVSKAEQQMLRFHAACLEPRSLSDLNSTLMYRYSGGWPAVEETGAPVFKRKKPTWMHTLIAFHGLSTRPYLFKQRIEIKSNRRYVQLMPSDTQSYSMSEYENKMQNVLKTYNVSAAKLPLIALETLNFERLRRSLFAAHKTEQKVWNYTCFKEEAFAGLDTAMDWDYYFKKVLGKALRPNDVIVVHDFNKLQQIFLNVLQNNTMTRLLNWIWIDYLMDKDYANCQTITQSYFKPVYEHVLQRSAWRAEEMTKMYMELKNISMQQTVSSAYLDELLQQQFIAQVNWWTLHRATTLDDLYAGLTISRKKFFRNLEKMQKFMEQNSTQLNSYEHANSFTKYFTAINSLIGAQNLTVPLNYMLVAQHYTEQMLSSGIPKQTELKFKKLRIYADEILKGNLTKFDPVYIMLKTLSHEISFTALRHWMERNVQLTNNLEKLLAAGSMDLTLEKLYFIGSVLASCQSGWITLDQNDFVQIYLRNSYDFASTFDCKTL